MKLNILYSLVTSTLLRTSVLPFSNALNVRSSVRTMERVSHFYEVVCEEYCFIYDISMLILLDKVEKVKVLD